MIAHKAGFTALRRAAAKQPNALLIQNLSHVPAASNVLEIQRRLVATESVPAKAAASILAAQRLNRPVAPHLTIYDPAQTWFTPSIWQRFTGAGFSAALYLYAASYLVAPLTGWHLESASLAAAIGAWPVALKGGLKFFIAWPFVFHALNGVRHFVFDFAKGFARPQIKTWGLAVWGASVLGGLGIAFLL